MKMNIKMEKFLSPVSPFPLAALRIGVAFILLIQGFLILNHLNDLYGETGLVQKELYDYLNGPVSFAPRLATITDALSSLGLAVSYHEGLVGIYAFYLASLFFLLIGLWTRFFAFSSWLTHLVLMNSAPSLVYGADKIHHILLFYFIIFPIAEVWSVDQWFSPASPKEGTLQTLIRTLSLRLAQFQLCLIYFQSGTAKTTGFMWWNGEAIWRSIMGPGYQQYDFSWLARFPWLALMGCFATLIIEIAYPLCIWMKKTRQLWVVLTIILHLGIALFQGLWIFSLTMIILNIAVFSLPQLSRASWAIKFLKEATRKLDKSGYGEQESY